MRFLWMPMCLVLLALAGCGRPHGRRADWARGELDCPMGARLAETAEGFRCVGPEPMPVAEPEVAAADPLVGAFAVSGVRPDGATYTGDAAVSALGKGGPYRVVWSIGGSSYAGVATKRGDVLSVGWGDDDQHGVVDYVAKGDGTLDGVWYDARSVAPGRELLTGGLPNLAGVYTIEKGFGPSGEPYAGTCDVAVMGELHVLMWHVGKDTFRGLGIRSGDVLSVGFSTAPSGAFGVVQYRVEGNRWMGRWAEWSQKVPTLGSETLLRK